MIATYSILSIFEKSVNTNAFDRPEMNHPAVTRKKIYNITPSKPFTQDELRHENRKKDGYKG